MHIALQHVNVGSALSEELLASGIYFRIEIRLPLDHPVIKDAIDIHYFVSMISSFIDRPSSLNNRDTR